MRRVHNFHAIVVVRRSLVHRVDELVGPALLGVVLGGPLELKLFEVGVERGKWVIALLVVVCDDAGGLEDDALEVLQQVFESQFSQALVLIVRVLIEVVDDVILQVLLARYQFGFLERIWP